MDHVHRNGIGQWVDYDRSEMVQNRILVKNSFNAHQIKAYHRIKNKYKV